MDKCFRILAKFCQNSRRYSDCDFHLNSSSNQMSLEFCKNSAANCSSDKIPTRKVRRFESDLDTKENIVCTLYLTFQLFRSEFCHWSRQHRNSDRNDLKRLWASPPSFFYSVGLCFKSDFLYSTSIN